MKFEFLVSWVVLFILGVGQLADMLYVEIEVYPRNLTAEWILHCCGLQNELEITLTYLGIALNSNQFCHDSVPKFLKTV